MAWPPSERLSRNRVRTTWELTTLADLPVPRKSPVDLSGISRDMDFAVTLTGPRTLTMVCTCRADMAEPYRLGSAGLAWRNIDEGLARLWMIGNSPRAHYPAFMRQRRELVNRLSPSARIVWLWMSMIRAEPLLAGAAAENSKAAELLASARAGDLDTRALGRFSSLAANAVKDALLGQAVTAAVNGRTTGSVDAMAAATERLFDALLVVDDAEGDHRSSHGLAADEDRAWFADCRDLVNWSGEVPGPVIERSRRMLPRA